MIKIDSVEKIKDNMYFIVYKKNNEIFTYSGDSKAIMKLLIKEMK